MSEAARSYITTIVVDASPMTLAEFYNSRGQSPVSGWEGRKGYIVRRLDRDDGQENNEIWVSEGNFNLNYTPMSAMDFGSALQNLYKLSHVARSCWASDKFIFRVLTRTKKATRMRRYGSWRRGELIPVQTHICMWSDGRAVPWVPSYDDMFSRDWRIVNPEE